MSRWTQIRIWIIGILILGIYLLLQFGINLYTDFLWFQHLQLESVYLTALWGRIGVGLAVALPFALIFLLNMMIARWQSIRNVLFFSEETMVAQKFVVWLIWGVTLFLTWVVGNGASGSWLLFLKFFNQQPFGLADPIFNRDISFYLFSLPFYSFVQTWLIIVLFLSLFGALGIYALAQQNNLSEGRIVVLPHVQLHLSILGALIFLLFGVGHWLGMFDLLYSDRGVAFGASYTDIHVSLPALRVMIAVAVIAALLLVLNAFLRRPALSLGAVFLWILVGIVSTGFIPGIVQRYVVEPNELDRETPYIENNIEYTGIAYGLDRIQGQDFPEVQPLTQISLDENEATLRNIRLWDYRPLLQTYRQLQAIRLYYNFLDIDLDRYMIGGELRQVALSARELEKSRLQSSTWVNTKLQFTHSYGAVMNPVDQVTGEGLPQLWIKDLPPVSSIDLPVNRPEIYYGEATNDYVFVNTTQREFNYPSGDENIYADYAGEGGVMMDTYFKRLAFALRLGDLNMMLSQEFTPESRTLLHRNIQERVQVVAPFLQFDRDPYLVVGEEDGRLYWIQDAYTTSNRFPYSEPFEAGINYIRNSVKIVIDAYDGSLTFYLIDPDDPLASTYAEIFPQLFVSMNQMPAWIEAHLRYPEDLFRIQSRLYQTYHMRDVNVFYNKEDVWQIPMEILAGNTQPVEPYYVIVRSPGEAESEFVLMQPFTPNNKDNLIAWMAGRSDSPHYGELIVFRFPKQELIFGPLQIESRIDQNPEISAQITLWDQGGSEVIRGNLLVLPVDNSLLYVEPLYLQAEQGQIPELKRVILASGDRIVMRETLDKALLALFEGEAAVDELVEAPDVEAQPAAEAQPESAAGATPAPAPVEVEAPATDDVSQLALTASQHYEAAQAALSEGDWATYGAELDQMKAALDKLVELTGEQ